MNPEKETLVTNAITQVRTSIDAISDKSNYQIGFVAALNYSLHVVENKGGFFSVLWEVRTRISENQGLISEAGDNLADKNRAAGHLSGFNTVLEIIKGIVASMDDLDLSEI